MPHFRNDGDLFLSRQSLTNPLRLWVGKTDLVHEQCDTEACKAVSSLAWPLTSLPHLCRETFAAQGWQEGHWAGFEPEQHPSDTKFGLLHFLTPQRGFVWAESHRREMFCATLRGF